MTASAIKLPDVPALRQGDDDTALDPTRAQWAWDRFQSQDGAYRLRDRSVEENIRMLAGQQWMQYHRLLGWQDVTHWLTDEERRWRHRPVINRILPWWILTHARMTENPFTATFAPGPDRKDAHLAETFDVLFKATWREAGMTDVWDRAAAWMISAGAAYLQTRVDLSKGEWKPWIGQATLPVLGPDDQPLIDPNTGQPVMQQVDGVPFDKDGNPLAVLRLDGLQQTGEPHYERSGALVVDVLSPLEVRGQWGPLPWQEQKIHMMRSYMTPEEVWEMWQIECEPDITGVAATSAGFLERILFGTGFYGAASALFGSELGTEGSARDGYCVVQSLWQAPSRRIEGMQASPTEPGGRLLITTQNKVLRDGPRPFDFKFTSPLRQFEFLRLPGRPGGTTPQESLNSPQRAINAGAKQFLEHRALCTNPQQVYDLDSGLEPDQIDNMPARQYGVRMKAGVKPIEWITPPALGADAWRTQDWLTDQLMYVGSTHGTQPAQFSKDASGELVREMRFNDDRFLGPTMRRAAEEMGRLLGDWMVMWPRVHDAETVLKYTGDDNVARTMTLMPDIFMAGYADVIPDIESMQPEGRGERRARIYKMWQDGAFGDPLSPGALRQFHELSAFPHMSRTAKPGGVHWTTAEQENGELLQGGMPPTPEWYNDDIHLAVHDEFMAAPEFRRLPEPMQFNFVVHRNRHQQNLMLQQQRQMMQAAAAAALTGGGPGGAPPPKDGAPTAPTQPSMAAALAAGEII